MHLFTVLAQTVGSTGTLPSPGQQGAPAGGGLMQLLPLIVGMLAIFYFLLIRPQKKQEKAHKELLKGLKKGDKVVTIGGIHGVVHNVRDNDVTLKVDETGNVRVRFSRSAVSRVLDKDDAGEDSKGDAA